MLFVPNGDPTFRLVAIDPGTDTMGLAVLEVDLSTEQAMVAEAYTIRGDRMSLRYPQITETHGARASRLYALGQYVGEVFYRVQPHAVICEAPYMGRFPQAYGALVETLSTLRHALMNYDISIPLEEIDPQSAKAAVGVHRRGSNKEDVHLAIRNLEGLSYSPDVDPSLLDEHSSDAVAVGYYRYRQMLGV